MKKLLWTVLVGVLALAGSNVGFAAEKDKMDTGHDHAAMMAEMGKLSQPGENHKVLDTFVGKWQTTSKWWMNPDAAPEVSEGISENEWVLNGRFLKQSFKGKAMGQDFEGLGYLGYDNVAGEYVSVWMDSMGTGMMTSKSKYDPATRTFSEEGKFSCPITGEKDMAYRAHWILVDDKSHIYEMYMKDPESKKEFKSMEIHYERA